MARPKKESVEGITQIIEEAKPEKVAIEDMPLNSIRDYRLYNEEARRLNKKLKLCRYPIKQCPTELHPTQRIVISRNDGQSRNPIPVYLSNHMIHFEEKLMPGEAYELPECVINFLESKGHPVWEWAEGKNGARETVIASYDPRFSIRTIRAEV